MTDDQTTAHETTSAGVALVFPGQASQFVGMGKDVYDASPAARAVFTQANQVLGFDLADLCFNGPEEALNDTYNAQPAILTVSIACLESLREAVATTGHALHPLYMAGHSLGEYTALVAANVLDFADGLLLVRERGRLMKETGETRPGGMAAIVGLSQSALEEVCQKAAAYGIITLANQNHPLQTVISGELEALSRAMEMAKEAGAKQVTRLKVTIASHSPLMARVSQGLADLTQHMTLRDPEVPVIANITGMALRSADDLRHELINQVCQPVAWTRSVREMIEGGGRTFIEVGPGHVLSGLIRRINADVRTIAFKDLPRDLPSLFAPSAGAAS